jgi:2-dehydrotetronate isomerase
MTRQRFSAHIGYLYSDLPLSGRPTAAARDGFTAIEHPEPWSIPANDMRALLVDLGLTSQVTSGMGDVGKGEKGLAALAGREAEFRVGFDRALEYAVAIGCPFVHPMAGVPTGGVLDAAETYRLNLSWALSRVEGTGVRILVEAITIPGYHMSSLAFAAELQNQFHGRFDLLWAAKNADRIGHVHIADHPGRHEPGTGVLAFERILSALRAGGYAGAMGFEYVPSAATSTSAAFLPGWKRLLSEKVSP